MDLSNTGLGNECSGYGGGGGVCTPFPEYHCPVYRHLADTEAMSGGGATARGAGVDEMLGSGRNRPRVGRDGYGDGDGDGGGGGEWKMKTRRGGRRIGRYWGGRGELGRGLGH